MSEIQKWLLEPCNEIMWSPLRIHSKELENKIIRINIDENIKIGTIIEYHDDFKYTVHFGDKTEMLDLKNTSCHIKDDIISNREFCLHFGNQFLNYIKKSKDMELNISDKDFLKRFAMTIYYNSGF